ncbi:MAG: ATP-binding cassette domain-containing protein [Bacteroidaceae bacterium]|nr:ATP-binding cassette domain-containing protein [Bacteroidaceae bacterium]
MLTVANAQPLHPDFRLPRPLSFELPACAHLALVGPNGGGKTTLARIVAGALPLRSGTIQYNNTCARARMATFRDAWGDTLPAASHFLRWHHGESVETPTVCDFLGATAHDAEWLRMFPGMERLLAKPLLWLSSGELRKVHLLRALSGDTNVAIIDEPYIGLDTAARTELTAFLTRMATRCTLMLCLADEADVPPFVTHIARVENKEIKSLEPYTASASTSRLPEPHPLVTAPTVDSPGSDADEVIRLNDVSVAYFGKSILSHVSWTVRRGERWALTGSNGAGKSTLLSLVCADNPMAYACDVRVFGQRRGRGGTIWDVKRRLGYVSPELVRMFAQSRVVADVVASGLSDTGRLHRAATSAERDAAVHWLGRFGAEHLARRDFLTLSGGERRLVMLARAFVKRPELLLLDEPFHGLDPAARRRASSVIADHCAAGGTLVMVSHRRSDFNGLADRDFHLTSPETPKP